MYNQGQLWDKEYQNNKQKWKLETKTLPKLCKSKLVLELGVGNGKTLNAILRQKPKAVTAVDISQEAIIQCSKEFKKEPIEFIQASVTNLPFTSKDFDVVVCYYVLNNLLKEDREKAASEILRVLKSKGKVLFEDFALGDFRESESNTLVENHTIEKSNGLICHFFSTPELTSLFSSFKCKFKLKSSRPITHKPHLKRRIISGIMEKQKKPSCPD